MINYYPYLSFSTLLAFSLVRVSATTAQFGTFLDSLYRDRLGAHGHRDFGALCAVGSDTCECAVCDTITI